MEVLLRRPLQQDHRRTALRLVARGDGEERWYSDFWVTGNQAYTGTWGGSPRPGNLGDRIKIWRLSESGAPTLADSLMLNVLTVGDVEVSDNGRLLVVATEPGFFAGKQGFMYTGWMIR